MLNYESGKEEEEEESCVSVRLRGSGEVERRWRDGRLELSYQNGNKKIIRQGRSQQGNITRSSSDLICGSITNIGNF